MKKIVILVLAGVCLGLSGCSVLNIDYLPPDDSISALASYTVKDKNVILKYPVEWNNVEVRESKPSSRQKGSVTAMIFHRKIETNTAETYFGVNFQTVDFEPLSVAEKNEWDNWDGLDLNKTDQELTNSLRSSSTSNRVVKKITFGLIPGLLVKEIGKDQGGVGFTNYFYVFPKYDAEKSFNLIIYGTESVKSVLDTVARNFSIDEQL